jgi:hypothetical protein
MLGRSIDNHSPDHQGGKGRIVGTRILPRAFR